GLQLTDDSGNGMTIADGGNVGFGTSTPAGTLDVGPVGNTLCINGVCRTSWPTGEGIGAFYDSGTNAFYNGGDVGIGTDDPQTTLHVVGDITFEDAATGAITGQKIAIVEDSTNYIAKAGEHVIVGVGAMVRLPVAPVQGDEIRISPSGDWKTNSSSILCNGKKISGYAEDMTLDLNRAFKLIYTGTTIGWVIY
ncbi:MAG: hypothetical protein HN353_00230, partial [Bdellovibrionales bacterium]|nr:hypothetical protein [Bdellovibrionales bacterium]